MINRTRAAFGLCFVLAALSVACVPPAGPGTTTTTTTTTTTVPENIAPVAVASAAPLSGDAPLTVQFSSQDSTDPDGTIVARSWDFGDGSAPSTDADPTHVYFMPGAYTAELTVTDDDGATGTDSVEITVSDDPNGRYVATTGANDNDCSASATPCATVTYAIGQAQPGDSVYVAAGTYAGPIVINKANLTLRGAKAGFPAGQAADPFGRGTGETVIEAAGVNVISWSGTASIDSTIDGFTIRNTDRHGVVIGTSGHTIVNNMIEYPAGLTAANAQQAAFSAGRINGLTFKNNNLSGFRYGFNFQSGNLADAPTVIEDNYVDYVFTGAILGNNTADGHAIRNNTFVARPGAGGQAVNTPSRQMEISGNSMTGGGGASGIFLPGTAPQSGTQITGNTISGYTWGIYVGTANANLPVGSPPNEVHQNNLSGNSQWSLFNQSAPGVADIDATCNWFGSASGPGVGTSAPAGNRVTDGNVNFTPWLTAPAPGGECVGGL